MRAFLETFITSTNVSRRLQGEVGQSVLSKNYIAAVLGKTLETYTEFDQVAFVVLTCKGETEFRRNSCSV